MYFIIIIYYGTLHATRHIVITVMQPPEALILSRKTAVIGELRTTIIIPFYLQNSKTSRDGTKSYGCLVLG